MKGFLILLRKELMTYFISPVAYILFVFFHVLMGFSVWYLVNLLTKEQTAISLVLPEVFGSIFFWLANLLVVPPLTMRVFAEEKKEGTLETLMTAPVRLPRTAPPRFSWSTASASSANSASVSSKPVWQT